jgi:CRP-like cAMP-binding protein
MRTIFDDSAEARERILQFLQGQMQISSQLSACNKLHEAEARLARWLLMASDRAQTEKLNLTQEFLAEMLGSQRTTVALVAGTLQRAGFIDYSRGRVRILDRDGLVSAACDCYGVTEKILHNLFITA